MEPPASVARLVTREAGRLLKALRERKHAPPIRMLQGHVCSVEECGPSLERVMTTVGVPVYLCPIGFKAHVCGPSFCSRSTRDSGSVVCTLTGRTIAAQVFVAEVGGQGGDLQINRFDRASRGKRTMPAARRELSEPHNKSRVRPGKRCLSPPAGERKRVGWGGETRSRPPRKPSKRHRMAVVPAPRHVGAMPVSSILKAANQTIVRLMYGAERVAMSESVLRSRRHIAYATARSVVSAGAQSPGGVNLLAAFHACVREMVRGLTFSAPVETVVGHCPGISRRIVEVWIALHHLPVALAVSNAKQLCKMLSSATFRAFCVTVLYMWRDGIVQAGCTQHHVAATTPFSCLGASTAHRSAAAAVGLPLPRYLLPPNPVLKMHLPPLAEVKAHTHLLEAAPTTMRNCLVHMCAMLNQDALERAGEEVAAYQ